MLPRWPSPRRTPPGPTNALGVTSAEAEEALEDETERASGYRPAFEAWSNEQGGVAWKAVAGDAGGVAAAAVCTAHGSGAVIASLCGAAGSAVGKALYDVGEAFAGLFGGSKPPRRTAIVLVDQAKLLAAAWWHDRDPAMQQELMALRALALTIAQGTRLLASTWQISWAEAYARLRARGLAVPDVWACALGYFPSNGARGTITFGPSGERIVAEGQIPSAYEGYGQTWQAVPGLEDTAFLESPEGAGALRASFPAITTDVWVNGYSSGEVKVARVRQDDGTILFDGLPPSTPGSMVRVRLYRSPGLEAIARAAAASPDAKAQIYGPWLRQLDRALAEEHAAAGARIGGGLRAGGLSKGGSGRAILLLGALGLGVYGLSRAKGRRR